MKRILVTGGAGFIGSEFVRQIIKKNFAVAVVDKLAYAGDFRRLKEVKNKLKFYKIDICNKMQLESVFCKEKPNIIVDFAAETHVDRSIQHVFPFINVNIIGTQNVLNAALKYNAKKIIHISTDEVYGDIKTGCFDERDGLRPSNPYAASKASCDLFIRAYIRTYKLPAIIIRPSNNYGPWQYPEKFIPVVIYKAIKNEKIPIYGRGTNIREWLYVRDCAEGIFKVMQMGIIGEIYNLGNGEEKKNIDVAKTILEILGKSKSLIQFVKDRPGHDYRYNLNSSKIRKLGWKPKLGFEEGICKTVIWYKENFAWLEKKARSLRKYWKSVYEL